MSSGPLVTNLLATVIWRISVVLVLGFIAAFLVTPSWTARALVTPAVGIFLYFCWLGVDRLRQGRQS